jgi:hypothetical protein
MTLSGPKNQSVLLRIAHRSAQAGTSWISVWYFLVEIIIYSLPVAL